jgi:hypothetical protein
MKILFAMLTLVLLAGFCFGDDTAATPSGKEIFMTAKCNMCHTIESQSIKAEMEAEEEESEAEEAEDEATPPDLSDVGSRHEAAWMSNYLQKKEMLHEKKHSKRFTGTEEELSQLVTWLSSLKIEEESK